MDYMADAIDRQYEAWMEQEREWYTLATQLGHEGWHYCRLNRQLSTEEYNEMTKWLHTNYYGRHEYFNDEFMFPTEQDANWFMLRWA